MSEDLLSLQDLIDNPMTRVPICLCLDTSGSMNAVVGGDYTSTEKTVQQDGKTWKVVSGNAITRLSELQKGLQLFYDAIKADEIAKYSAEICVIQFNDSASCLADFGSIEAQEVPILRADGSTHMGEAINMALDLLEKRKQDYKNNGVDYYQPWLVVMTDGEDNGPASDLEKASSRVNDLVNTKKLTIFPIAIGNEADKNALAKISPKRKPLKLQGLKFEEFFAWLSKSVSKTSQSVPGEKVSLDVEGLKDWAEL